MKTGLILIVWIALQCQAHSAYAAAFSPGDDAGAIRLNKQLLQLTRDVSEGRRSAGQQSWECLSETVSDLTTPYDVLEEIIDLVDISLAMQTGSDEAVVNAELAILLNYGHKAVDTARKGINLNAGYCRQDMFVNQKASQAFRIFSEMDEIIDSLQRKLGTAKR